MKILYFAWARERTGTAAEDVQPPQEVKTLQDLLGWLAGRDETHAWLAEEQDRLRFAIDQAHARPDQSVSGAREIAIFPPVTGG